MIMMIIIIIIRIGNLMQYLLIQQRLSSHNAAIRALSPVSVKRNVLLREPWPCNPAAETAIRPLIWCFESWLSRVPFSPEECFFHRHRREGRDSLRRRSLLFSPTLRYRAALIVLAVSSLNINILNGKTTYSNAITNTHRNMLWALLLVCLSRRWERSAFVLASYLAIQKHAIH